MSSSSLSEGERGIEAFVLEDLVRNTVLKCEQQRELSLIPASIARDSSEPPWERGGMHLNSGRVAQLASVSEASSDGRLYTPSPRPPLGLQVRSRGANVAWKEFCAEDEDFGFLVQPRSSDPERPEWPSHYVLHYWTPSQQQQQRNVSSFLPSLSDRKMVLRVVSSHIEPQYPCYCGCLEGKQSGQRCTDGEMDLLIAKKHVRRTVSARMVGQVHTSLSKNRDTKSDGCSQFSTDSEEGGAAAAAGSATATDHHNHHHRYSSTRRHGGCCLQEEDEEDEEEAEDNSHNKGIALSSLLFGANYLMSASNAPSYPAAAHNSGGGGWSPAAGSVGSNDDSGDDDDQRSKTTTGAKMTRARKRREQRKRRRQRLRDEELAMLMKSSALESPYHQPSASPSSSAPHYHHHGGVLTSSTPLAGQRQPPSAGGFEVGEFGMRYLSSHPDLLDAIFATSFVKD